MGKLLNIREPEAGGDPLKLWETVKEIIDALNDLTVSIIPAELCSIRMNDGDIEFNFAQPDPVTQSPVNSGSGGAGAGGGSGAGSGGVDSGGSTDSGDFSSPDPGDGSDSTDGGPSGQFPGI